MFLTKEGKECIGGGAKCVGEGGKSECLEVGEAVNNAGESVVEVVLWRGDGGRWREVGCGWCLVV